MGMRSAKGFFCRTKFAASKYREALLTAQITELIIATGTPAIIGAFMITAVRPAASRVRWTVCALLFFATTINYVDRQVLSILAKTLETSIGWTSIDYGYITAAFQFAYLIGLFTAGRVIDGLVVSCTI